MQETRVADYRLDSSNVLCTNALSVILLL